jgi:hypothetical protein
MGKSLTPHVASGGRSALAPAAYRSAEAWDLGHADNDGSSYTTSAPVHARWGGVAVAMEASGTKAGVGTLPVDGARNARASLARAGADL